MRSQFEQDVLLRQLQGQAGTAGPPGPPGPPGGTGAAGAPGVDGDTHVFVQDAEPPQIVGNVWIKTDVEPPELYVWQDP